MVAKCWTGEEGRGVQAQRAETTLHGPRRLRSRGQKPVGLCAALGALLALAPITARAVLEEWTGLSGTGSNFSDDANWSDGSAPASNLSFTDVRFGQVTSAFAWRNPNVDGPYMVHSVGFYSNAPEYVFYGTTLKVGTGGISNQSSALNQEFVCPVDFSGVANSSVSVGNSNGFLRFTGATTRPTGTLTVDTIGSVRFNSLGGSSSSGLTKQGIGTLYCTFSGSVGGTLAVSGGRLETGTASGTDVFTSTGAISVSASGELVLNRNLTLDGATLTVITIGNLQIASGKTLRVQNGGSVSLTGTNDRVFSSANVVVTGPGSSFVSSGNTTSFPGSTVSVQAGASFSGNLITFAGTNLSSLTVSGAGSTATASLLRLNGGNGTATFNLGSSGSFTAVEIGMAAPSANGSLQVQGGASVVADSLGVAATDASGTGSVTVSATGSQLAATGAITIGSANNSSAMLTVQNGAFLTTGTSTQINATGTLNIQAGGTLRGASSYTGVGSVMLAGNLQPGMPSGPDRTRSISFAQSIAFQSTSHTTMELAGTTAGTDYDQITFNGGGLAQVTWDGTLNVVPILGFIPQNGDVFDLFNFDPAKAFGAFATINLPALPSGRFWRNNLYSDGTLRVSSVPDSYAEWQIAYGTGAFELDDDNDGIPNGVEFLLGTNPKFSSASPLRELAPVVVGFNLQVGMTFQMPQTPAADARYRIEGSDDMRTWREIASKDGAGPWSGTASVATAAPVAGYVQVTVTEMRTFSTVRRFHRLVAALP